MQLYPFQTIIYFKITCKNNDHDDHSNYKVIKSKKVKDFSKGGIN